MHRYKRRARSSGVRCIRRISLRQGSRCDAVAVVSAGIRHADQRRTRARQRRRSGTRPAPTQSGPRARSNDRVRPSHRNRSRRLPERPASGCGPRAAAIAAITFARSPSASKLTRKNCASWGRKANCCARSSPLLAQKRRVLACPVLYRSGAPDTIRTCDLCLRRATLYPAELRVLRGSFSRLAWPRQRRCRGGGAGSKAPKAKVTRSNRVGCARKVGAGRAGTVAARFPRIGTSNGRPMVD
jgi:hypothetical protein